MKLPKSIIYIGVNDHKTDLFEGMYDVPNGMAYNSYVVKGEKIAVMDTVDRNFGEEWLANLDAALGGALPDYLVVQHMEPDHSANIATFLAKYPQAKVVGSAPAFVMMKCYFADDYATRRIIVKDGDSLDLGGGHVLRFISAPLVHWPEVTMTYDTATKTLFSADAFGKFGALDVQEPWRCEARRYYFGIVGKFGAQVQALLKKAASLEIQTICPLHGPVLSENLGEYIEIYDAWSSYKPEDDGIVVAYTSVYGHTKEAVDMLVEALKAKGVKVSVFDLARCDMAEAVEDAFRYSTLVLASTTYNGGVFPFMRDFIHHLTERNYQNRKVAFIQNGSWAPFATKTMKDLLASSKNLTSVPAEVSIKGALAADSKQQLQALIDALA